MIDEKTKDTRPRVKRILWSGKTAFCVSVFSPASTLRLFFLVTKEVFPFRAIISSCRCQMNTKTYSTLRLLLTFIVSHRLCSSSWRRRVIWIPQTKITVSVHKLLKSSLETSDEFMKFNPGTSALDWFLNKQILFFCFSFNLLCEMI